MNKQFMVRDQIHLQEEWRQISLYLPIVKDYYFVSNSGDIMNKDTYLSRKNKRMVWYRNKYKQLLYKIKYRILWVEVSKNYKF